MHLDTSSEPSSSGSAPNPLFLFGALLGAGAGALAWAAVSYFTGYEVGYVAWAIGGLVGLATVKFGGHGVVCAVLAAAFSVAGIAGGKLLGTRFVVDQELSKAWKENFTPELHAELKKDAAALMELGNEITDEELRPYLVDHDYTAARTPDEVQPSELQEFRAHNVDDLRELHTRKLSFEAWYAKTTTESRQQFDGEFSIVQANIDELNGIDILFVLLGVCTAFGIVNGAGAPPPKTVYSSGDRDLRKAA